MRFQGLPPTQGSSGMRMLVLGGVGAMLFGLGVEGPLKKFAGFVSPKVIQQLTRTIHPQEPAGWGWRVPGARGGEIVGFGRVWGRWREGEAGMELRG